MEVLSTPKERKKPEGGGKGEEGPVRGTFFGEGGRVGTSFSVTLAGKEGRALAIEKRGRALKKEKSSKRKKNFEGGGERHTPAPGPMPLHY